MIKLCRSPTQGAAGETHPNAKLKSTKALRMDCGTTMKDQVNEDLSSSSSPEMPGGPPKEAADCPFGCRVRQPNGNPVKKEAE